MEKLQDAKQGENTMNFEIDNVANQTVLVTFVSLT
jgi:hypothetical protein